MPHQLPHLTTGKSFLVVLCARQDVVAVAGELSWFIMPCQSVLVYCLATDVPNCRD